MIYFLRNIYSYAQYVENKFKDLYGSFHEIRWQKIWVLKGIKSDRLNKQNDQNEHNPFIEYHKSILNYMLIWCLCQNVRKWWTINIQHSTKCWYFKFQIAKKKRQKRSSTLLTNVVSFWFECFWFWFDCPMHSWAQNTIQFKCKWATWRYLDTHVFKLIQ